MLSRSIRRTAAVFLFGSLLAAPWAFAAGRTRPASPRPAQVSQTAGLDLFSRAWNLLTGVWAKTGCHIDPDGRCISSPPPPPPATEQTETGCGIDPDGRLRCGS